MRAGRGLIVTAIVVASVAASPGPASARASDAPRQFYGVVSQGSSFSDGEIGRLRRGGVGSVRFIVPWNRVERQPGSFDFSQLDAELEAIERAGARPIPVLIGAPAWIGDVREPPLGSPEAELGWRRFLAALVRRYGPGGEFWAGHPAPQPIRAWQIWNEPNLPSFWGYGTPRADDYVTLLRLSALAIHDLDPGAELILAGLSPAPKGVPPPRYLRRVYRVYDRLGIEPDFDEIAAHPYARLVSESRRQVGELVRAAVAATGAKPRMLVAEVGWGSGGPRRHPISGTRAKQAERLRKVFRAFELRRRRWRIDAVLWYAWRDLPRDRDSCPFCGYVGLFRDDGRPKPAWKAFRRVAAQAARSRK